MMANACLGDDATASKARATPSGADLDGWSVLPLLGNESGTGQWLFVSTPSAVVISRGPVADAQFAARSTNLNDRWPFDDATFAGVVLDGDSLARGGNGSTYTRMLAEALRVSRSAENVLVACTHRRVPRRLNAWRDYGRRTADLWNVAAKNGAIALTPAAFLQVDGARISTVTPLPTPPQSSIPRDADRMVLRALRPDRTILDAMLDDAAASCGTGIRVERISVRKIGKTAVFLMGAEGRRYVMRVARTPVALRRARRNFETIEALQRSALPGDITARAPQAIARGSRAGFEFAVETCLEGRAGWPYREERSRASEWAHEAVAYIVALHAATKSTVAVDADLLRSRVEDPIARIASFCATREAEDALRRTEAACLESLGGRTLSLVQTHGDFTETNCLFDRSGRLAGVVDWELADARGFPFLDLLQLMPVAGESGSATHWQRFDAWLELWRQPSRLTADPVFRDYTQRFDLTTEVVRGLILLQWITHVADRIDARGEDARWLRLRVQQPLVSLGRMFRE